MYPSSSIFYFFFGPTDGNGHRCSILFIVRDVRYIHRMDELKDETVDTQNFNAKTVRELLE